MLKNKIPYNCVQMDVETLTDTTAGKAGTKLTIRKCDGKWVGTIGKETYCLLLDFLRDSNMCKLSNMS